MTELFSTPGISYVMLPNTLLVIVTIIEPLNCYVILSRTLSLMVKLLLGSQGMLPMNLQRSLLLCQKKIVREPFFPSSTYTFTRNKGYRGKN